VPKLPASTSTALATAPKRPSTGTLDERLAAAQPSERLVLLVDVSASMGAEYGDTGSRLDAAKAAINSFLDACDRRTSSVGLLSFSDNPRLLTAPTATYAIVKVAADRLHDERGTELAPALYSAMDHAPTRLILLSDGMPMDKSLALAAVKAVATKAIPIDTIYIGDDEQGEAFMRQVANATGGHFTTAHSAASLTKSLVQLEARNRLRLTHST